MALVTKSIKYLFIFCFFIIVLSALAILFVTKFHNGEILNKFFEENGPKIEVLGDFSGVGSNGNALKFKVTDDISGLDEVKVQIIQKNRYMDLFVEKQNGELSKEFEVDINPIKLKLTESDAKIIISAYDKSFYNNSSETSFNISVDARKPELKLISTQHNLNINGVQLVIYKASDDNMSRHGVQVGNNFFQGFPIKLIDKEVKDKDVYVTFYSIGQGETLKPKLVAEDESGNRVSKGFYNKVVKRKISKYPLKVTPYFLNVMKERFGKENKEKQLGQNEEFLKEILGEKKQNESQKIFKALKNKIFKIKLMTPFILPNGTVMKTYGSNITYYYEDEELLFSKETGMTFSTPATEETINAIADGAVIFVNKMETYGNIVAVAHGGSVVSLYARSGDPLVKAGDFVKAGDPLMQKHSTGLSVMNNEFLLEIRVDGYTVNPLEFFDKSWCYEHINKKINLAKEDLGLLNVEFDY